MQPTELTPRVGYVLKMYPRFSETFVVSELLSREEAGHELHVFSLRYPVDGRFHAPLADVRAGVTYLPHQRIRAAELWTELYDAAERLPGFGAALPDLLHAPVTEALQAVQLAKQAQAQGITHLHAHFASVATTVARLASLLTGIPYSFTAHAKDLFHISVDPADLRSKVRDAAAAVTVTDYNADFLRTSFPDLADRVVTVRNGLRLDDFPFQSSRREPVVAAVGRLVEKKGFPDLLRAVALLRDRGRPVRTVLAGAGPMESELSDLVCSLHLGDLVELVGPLPQHDIRALVSRAAVLAAPCVTAADGNADGLPTVLLEAMALGTPVVATSVTGIPELVRHDDTGLVVPEHDPPALAAALDRVLRDGDLGMRLAASGRSLVERDYDGRRQAVTLGELTRRGRGSGKREVA